MPDAPYGATCCCCDEDATAFLRFARALRYAAFMMLTPLRRYYFTMLLCVTLYCCRCCHMLRYAVTGGYYDAAAGRCVVTLLHISPMPDTAYAAYATLMRKRLLRLCLRHFALLRADKRY